MSCRLLYFDGSPFARFVRILAMEWGVEMSCEEIKVFPFEDALFDETPFGQVPVLYDGDDVLFPTQIIVERLAERAGIGLERQKLAVALQMGDALVAAKYQEWAGLGPVAENFLGFDPAARHMERVFRTLDWFADCDAPEGVSAHIVAVAVFLLWAESRGPIPWRGDAWREALVDFCAKRASFRATEPTAWEPER